MRSIIPKVKKKCCSKGNEDGIHLTVVSILSDGGCICIGYVIVVDIIETNIRVVYEVSATCPITLSDGITMTLSLSRWRFKSLASRLFAQLLVQAQIKENIKAPRRWPLCGEFTGDRWIPQTIGL